MIRRYSVRDQEGDDMAVKVVGRNSTNTAIEGRKSLGELRKVLNLREDQYVSLVNGDPATEDEFVTDNDDVVFLEVFSGG